MLTGNKKMALICGPIAGARPQGLASVIKVFGQAPRGAQGSCYAQNHGHTVAANCAAETLLNLHIVAGHCAQFASLYPALACSVAHTHCNKAQLHNRLQVTSCKVNHLVFGHNTL